MLVALRNIILILLTSFLSHTASAEQVLDIVTDPWPPYAYEENGKIIGSDVEIAQAVFKELGIKANIRFLPWKRCLALVKARQADAILAASITDERKEFLFFPDTPISKGITVLFKNSDVAIDAEGILKNTGYRAGAILGYKYCEQLDNSPLVKNAARVNELEQNFNKLLLGRLDLVVAVESVGLFKALQMGIQDKVSILPHTQFCPGGNFLAFSQKPGHRALAKKFGNALKDFEKTKTYKDILSRYGRTL